MARHTKGLTVLIATVSTLGPYTIDAFFPSLRAIAVDLGISVWQAQQLLTVFMVPYAIMSLAHGSLSDALGRRRVILVGLVVYVLASIGCVLAPGFGALLAFRVLQGMVAGAGHIVGRAVVRDCYHGVKAQQVMSSITMIFALGPALAPIIGGWVHVWLGWRAVFGTMALFGVIVLLLIWRKLPETHPPEKRSELHLGAILANTLNVMRNRDFQWLTASSCLCFIALHAYIGSAPAIILDHWQMNETSFAALSVPIIGGYALGAYFSGKLAGRMDPERMVRFGYHSSLIVAVAILLLQLVFDEPPVPLQQLLLAASAAGLQLMFPVITLRILDLFDNARGTAASAHAFFSMVLSALMMGIIAPWLSQTMFRLAEAGLACTIVGWSIWYFKLRRPLQAAG
jgi:MFS transporter, DHA1 family, multidrug resistance protein